jgi:hypothetical protein
VRDHDHVAVAVADRGGRRLRVLLEAGGVVLARQVDRQDVVAAPAQVGLQQVPVPG